jgi:hypothetical protein
MSKSNNLFNRDSNLRMDLHMQHSDRSCGHCSSTNDTGSMTCESRTNECLDKYNNQLTMKTVLPFHWDRAVWQRLLDVVGRVLITNEGKTTN